MWEWIMSRALESIAPPDGSKARKRFNVGIIACLALFGVVLLFLLSFGFAPWLFPGFAHADTVTAGLAQEHTEVQASVADEHRHWAYEIEDALLTLRMQQCKAPAITKEVFARSIQQRLNEYQRLTGTPYAGLPACSDL